MILAFKMAARVAALITLGAGLVILLGTMVSMIAGAEGIGILSSYIGVAFTFINHWTGGVGGWLIGVAGTLFVIEAALVIYKIGLIGVKFALKVAEG